MDELFFVDRIEGNTAVLISYADKKRKYVSISSLPNLCESDILKFDGEKYLPDEEEKNKRIDRMRDKLNGLNVKNKK